MSCPRPTVVATLVGGGELNGSVALGHGVGGGLGNGCMALGLDDPSHPIERRVSLEFFFLF